MNRTLIIIIPCLLGCSDQGGTSTDGGADSAPGLLGYGSVCTVEGDCLSGLCLDGFCSKICKRFVDCPTINGQSFDCGEVAEQKKIACYPKRYKTAKYALGHDCSLDGTCGIGYTCTGMAGSADRYCSASCKTDRDCPPRYRCAAQRAGNGQVEQLCRRREFCHPCAIDDQCGPENLCITDTNGNKYCGKSCTSIGATCPVWAKCEDAGNGKLQCKHKAGYCYKSFTSEGDLCQPCIIHGWIPSVEGDTTLAEEGMCKKDGYCFLLTPYTLEAACITPCAAGGTCPDGYGCMQKVKTLGGGDFCIPITVDPETGYKVVGSCVK